jgi:hypothetical protein
VSAAVEGQDSVVVELSFENAIIDYALGYFGQHEYSLDESITFFDGNTIPEGLLMLERASMHMRLENFIGVDARLRFTDISSINTQNAIKSIADLDNELNGTVSTIGDHKMTVESLQQELESTEYGTERFNELKTALIEANTQLKNYELSIEALDNEQLASELKSVAGGFMDIVGGLTLIGVSGEGMEKIVQTFAKVEGATKMVTGAIELYSSGMKVANTLIVRAAAAHGAMAAAQTAQAGATAGSTIAMKALNVVMNANPVFLLITGVTALVAAFAIFSNSSESAADAASRLNEELDYQKNIMAALTTESKRLNSTVINQYENELKLLEERGASEAEIEAKRKEIFELKKKDMTEEMSMNEKLRDEQVQAYAEVLSKSDEFWNNEVKLVSQFGKGARFNLELVLEQLDKIKRTSTSGSITEEKEALTELLNEIVSSEQNRKKLRTDRFNYEQNFANEEELRQIELENKRKERAKKQQAKVSAI